MDMFTTTLQLITIVYMHTNPPNHILQAMQNWEVKLWEGDKLLTNLHPQNKQLSGQA